MIYFELLHPLQISSDGRQNNEGKWPNWTEVVSNLKEQKFPRDAFMYGDEHHDFHSKNLISAMLSKNGDARPTALCIKEDLRRNLEIDCKGNF